MKKLLVLGLLSLLFMVLASSCEDRRHEKEVVKIQKNINTALTKNDFVKAHQYLGELMLLDYCCIDLPSRKKVSVQDVYLAEIRYLVSKNDESSWNRAQMLPMEVPNGFEKVQGDLYQALYDYAVAFDNEEVKEKVAIALAYLKGDRLIMPVSTSIAGSMGDFYEIVDKEDGYKMIVEEKGDTWQWKLTVEIKRIKDGKAGKNGLRDDDRNIRVSLLDEDNAEIDFSTLSGCGKGLKVGESSYNTFSKTYFTSVDNNLLKRSKTITKFKMSTIE